ncbi:unnamed protein product [Anisakis simplex]|uniref:G_PROTEIN_RECEP_F1_2 domain-containing protein n=1 Tax=Anisakis simplex TaxID=6269 RepID=A0A0M3JSI5_ANISI|nr:unnamed protein product [Anisakis simplex]
MENSSESYDMSCVDSSLDIALEFKIGELFELITAVSLWSTPLSYYRTVWEFGRFMCYAVYAVQMILCGNMARRTSRSFTLRTNSAYGSECSTTSYNIVLSLANRMHPQTANRTASDDAFCEHNFSRLRYAADIRRKQRLQTLLLVMVIIFGVSSFPLDLFNVIQGMSHNIRNDSFDLVKLKIFICFKHSPKNSLHTLTDMELAYRTELISQEIKQVIFLVTHWVAMVGTLCNPLVYAWWSDNFRRDTQVVDHCSVN